MSEVHLLDLQLDVLHRARLDRLGCLLDGSLDKDDRFGVDAFDPAHHLLRNELGLDLDETLDRVGLLAENDKDHLRTCQLHRGVRESEIEVKRLGSLPHLERAKFGDEHGEGPVDPRERQ